MMITESRIPNHHTSSQLWHLFVSCKVCTHRRWRSWRRCSLVASSLEQLTAGRAQVGKKAVQRTVEGQRGRRVRRGQQGRQPQGRGATGEGVQEGVGAGREGMDDMDDVRNDSGVGDVDRGDTLGLIPLSCWPSRDIWLGTGSAPAAAALDDDDDEPLLRPAEEVAAEPANRSELEREVVMGWLEKRANGEKGVEGASMFSTEG